MIDREHDIVICRFGLDARIEDPEGGVENLHIVLDIVVPRIVPVLVVDLISHDPVRDLPHAVFPVVALREVGGHRLRRAEAGLCLYIKGVVERLLLRELRDAASVQLRHGAVPAIQKDGRHRDAGIREPLHLLIQLIDEALIDLEGLSLIKITDALSEKALRRDIHTGVLDI